MWDKSKEASVPKKQLNPFVHQTVIDRVTKDQLEKCNKTAVGQLCLAVTVLEV